MRLAPWFLPALAAAALASAPALAQQDRTRHAAPAKATAAEVPRPKPGSAAAEDEDSKQLAIATLKPEGGPVGQLAVTSSAFQAGAALPARFAAKGENLSPPLAWSKGPPKTGSYAIIVEDPDAPGAQPFVHWLIYDIPSGVTALPQGLPTEPRLDRPDGARQGKNSFGSIGWRGMAPPPGSRHRYHFEVFALDRGLDLDPGADRAEVIRAMRGHVLAAGDLMGTFAAR